MSNNVIKIEDYRRLEDIIKNRLGSDAVIIATVQPDGSFNSYFSPDITDIDLVYAIQTLKDLRDRRNANDT